MFGATARSAGTLTSVRTLPAEKSRERESMQCSLGLHRREAAEQRAQQSVTSE